jgi:hypothetical protein
MVEWWTYVPADFQLFSARTYARLVEAHNRALWPAQWLMLACGAAALLALLRRVGGAARLLAALSALWCLTVAWDFLVRRYAQIHWAAPEMALGFALQALLLALLARRDALERAPGARARAVAAGLLLLALAGMPLLAPLSGASWWRAEVVGLMPAPTVLAMLALAPLTRPGLRRALLLALPLAWCVVEAVTQAALGAPAWPLLPLAALLSLLAGAGRRPRTAAAAPQAAHPG